MNWLVLAFAFEAGLMPSAELWNTPAPELAREDSGYYTTLDSEFRIAEYGFIGGHVTTYMWTRSDSFTSQPFRADYGFRLGARYRGLEIGWRHVCSHPIAANWQLIEEYPYEAAYDQLYIRFSGSVDLLGETHERRTRR